ncbi:unnamed protein product [Staurois parvus]|uniref:Uncharacterized protein n=1 Tax=Staurois parvus TaxID=386267 RepID=A0ABN9CRE4_9NEOB|nr:unnamed protein product [Staurois parvus]
MCGCPIICWKCKFSTYRGPNLKTPQKNQSEMMQQASPFCRNIIAATQNGTQ